MYAAWRYNIYGAGRVIYQVTDLGRKPFRIQVFFREIRQVIHAHVPLSPSSRIRCGSSVGDALRLGRQP